MRRSSRPPMSEMSPWSSPASAISGLGGAGPKLLGQQVDHRNLTKANGGQGQPGQRFAKPQTPLADLAKPKAQLGGAQLDDIPVAQSARAHRFAIEADHRIGGGDKGQLA